MIRRTRLLVAGLILTAGGAPGLQGVLVPGEREAPFIERIALPDFMALENRSELWLSRSCDLILCPTRDGVIGSALALQRRSGDYFLIDVAPGAPGATERFVRHETALPPEIARQVEEAVELMLEYHVYAPAAEAREPSDHFGRSQWLFLRIGERQALAGIALGDALHQPRGPRAHAFNQITTGLRALLAAPENRNDLLVELDRVSGAFVAQARSNGWK